MQRSFIAVGGAAVLLALAAGGPPSAADSGPDQRHVEMRDDCDPSTFNAVLGDGACVGGGDTTFNELFDSLVERDPDGHWRNNPESSHVRIGHDLVISNTGGEFHTFGRLTTNEMSAGVHRFMRMIHPWMHTKVEVRRR